jgi:hypothetical protein
VEWADVLNKPTFFSGSYNDLTGKPEWVRPNQGTVNLSEFNNDLGDELPGTIAWGNVSNKPTFFSGSYNDLADKPEFADVSWEALRTGDPKTPAASMSGGGILVDASMNPSNNQSLGSTTAQWGSIHGLGVYAGEVDANTLYTGIALFKHPATSGFLVLQPLADLTALEIPAHFLPNINELHDLGSENQRWDKVHAKDGYFENLEVTDDIDLYNDIRFKNADGNTVARLKYDDDGVEVDGHMFPDGDAEFVLITIEKRWKEIRARDVKFSAIVTDSIATDSVTTDSIVTDFIVTETISGPSFFVGSEFISVNGKQIKSVGLPEIGSDAANKAYVDQRFLDTEIQWGMITGDDKPLIYASDGLHVLQRPLVPAPNTLGGLGTFDNPFFNISTASIGVKDTFNVVFGIISCMEKRVQHAASPVQDTDVANKEYVDNRVSGEALQTISSLQDQVNNLMNATLEIPSTTYFEFSFTNTYIQIYESSSIITLLFTNQNTVYTNLRLVLKLISEDGNLNKEVVFYVSEPQGILNAHNFTQKYSFNTFDIKVSGSEYPAPAMLKIDLMCDIYATGGARPTVKKSYLYNKKIKMLLGITSGSNGGR